MKSTDFFCLLGKLIETCQNRSYHGLGLGLTALGEDTRKLSCISPRAAPMDPFPHPPERSMSPSNGHSTRRVVNLGSYQSFKRCSVGRAEISRGKRHKPGPRLRLFRRVVDTCPVAHNRLNVECSALPHAKKQRKHSHGNRFSLELRNEGEVEEMAMSVHACA